MQNRTEQAASALDLAELRRRLRASDGRAYWRSLDELAGTTEFRAALEQEFPSLASEWSDPVSRRNLLKIMGASLALLGLNGCFFKKPQGTLVPYPQAPSEIIPGRPVYFATAMPFNGYGKGVLALSREGRPIKIEGNPDHPDSLGATDVFMQASILDLYDPDRSRNTRLAGQIDQWSAFRDMLVKRVESRRGDGRGLRILTGVVTSPTMVSQLKEFGKRFPGAQWHCFDPIRRASADGAARRPFSQPASIVYDLSHASVIVSFADDFLFRDPGSVRYARKFIDARRVRQDHKQMSRLYVVESTMTITGAMADHRVALRPSQIESAAMALAQALGAQLPSGATSPSQLPGQLQQWIASVAADLKNVPSGQSSLIVAGQSQPTIVHALVHAMNQRLGNVGKTVLYIDPVEDQSARSLKELVNDMQAGKVDTLLILGGNPVYNAPADVPFAEALDAMSQQMHGSDYANFTADLSLYYDETSFRCQWHVPKAHWLESWGDVRAFDGTASIIQPLIAPLYGGRSEWELLEFMLGRPDRMGIEIVQNYWREHRPGGGGADFEQWWTGVLQKGVIDGTAFKPHAQPPQLRNDLFAPGATTQPATAPGGYEVLFESDPCVWDGDFANNAWLQELPKPFTKLTWENAIIISPAVAQKLGWERGGLVDGDVVRLDYNGKRIEAPVVLLPGQADDMITLHLGYGRWLGGHVMREEDGTRGYNAYALRTSRAPWIDRGATIAAIGQMRALAITRSHHVMDALAGVPGIDPKLKPESIAQPSDSKMDLAVNNRLLVRTASLDYYKQHPDFVEELEPSKAPLLTLYPNSWDYNHGLQWGMTIDQTACIGCNACVIACQAENNIAVVGKKEVLRQREMHWIRIDSYFGGSIESPAVFHQPVPCMHCENAPCEYVCPVGATTHSDEGINEMTYNRCIGTRYCSNNCPYKVRRFNFLLYSNYESSSLGLLHNPDVTVRSRGVMEKCSYCIQRIDNTRAEMEQQVLELQERARKETDAQERARLMSQAEQRGREIVRRLQTACQQACPTEAIIFGDIRDPQSDVTKTKKEPTNYVLLKELTTKPRTSYLAKITNPNPALLAQSSPTTSGGQG